MAPARLLRSVRRHAASRRIAATLLAGCGLGAGMAEESFIVGPRALGMAGAQTASVKDVQAQYYNPAAFGFFDLDESGDAEAAAIDNNELGKQIFGLGYDFTVGGRVTGAFANSAKQAYNLAQNGNLGGLASAGVTSQADATTLINFSNALGNLATPGQGAEVDVNGGVGMRIGHFGIGARIFSQVGARVSYVDTVNLGLGGGQTLNQSMNSIAPAGNDNQTLLFSPAQVAQLESGPNALSAASVQKLDFLARQAGIPSSQAQQLANVLSGVGSGGTISQNATAASIYGFAAAEIPITYGFEIDDHVSLGVTGKLIVGRVYGTQALVLQDSASDALKALKANYTQTINVGIDAGIMGRTTWVNAGLVARDINSPSFKGGTFQGVAYPDYKLSPAVTAGVALIPYPTLTIEGDLDLTKNKTILDGYDTQNLSLGIEYNMFYALALRAGIYHNLAESDIGNIVTAGLGINLYVIRLDLAGAMSLHKTTIDGKSYPSEARASLQLSADF
jgi:hypothetical protein